MRHGPEVAEDGRGDGANHQALRRPVAIDAVAQRARRGARPAALAAPARHMARLAAAAAGEWREPRALLLQPPQKRGALLVCRLELEQAARIGERAVELQRSLNASSALMCCYGWADVAYVPREAHAAFRVAATILAKIQVEVAIPTALDALEKAGVAKWEHIQCRGGSLESVEWRSLSARLLCAHKVPLQTPLLSHFRPAPNCTLHRHGT